MISHPKKISILGTDGHIESIDTPFEDFNYIYPLYGSYFATTKNGVLHLSNSYKF